MFRGLLPKNHAITREYTAPVIILNPFQFVCDEDCDSSCNEGCDSSCDTLCNTGCESNCNTSCDSSCNFLATCGSSGRRLEDSPESITAEPKAIGWSERLAAAAAKESH